MAFWVFWLRVADVLLRRRRNERLSEEVQAHLDLLTEEYVAKGLREPDARLAARKAFGGVDQIKERYRDQRGLPWMDALAQDVRFAVRLMRRDAAFSLFAAGSLAVSIGALAIAFAVVHATAFKPLPIADPAAVFFVQSSGPTWSYPDYRDIRDRTNAVDLAGYRIAMMNVGLEPEPAILWGYLATGNYFDLLGVAPAVGRFFGPEDDGAPGAAPVAVLAFETWQSRFAGRADIIGREVTVNGRAYQVIGVAPRGFHGTEVFYRPEIWVPMSMQAEIEVGNSWLAERGTQNLMVIARLADGLDRGEVTAALAAAVDTVSREHPTRVTPLRVSLTRPGYLGDALGAPARAFAWGLFALGVVLLLAGCVNLAGLQLARGNDRVREIALRSALGAGRGRIARQLLTESVMLAGVGGIGGAAAAWLGTRAVSRWRLPTDIPFQLDITADGTVVAFAAATAVVIGVVVGLAPARFAARLDLARALKSPLGLTVGGRRLQGRDLLVGLQVAFCVVLLHASFLAVHGLQRATTASIGWNPDGVVMAATDLGLAHYTRERTDAYLARVVEDARALPGVVAAAAANSLPLHIDQSSTTMFSIPVAEPTTGSSATIYQVSPGYFATLRIPMRAGRDFTALDTARSPAVAVINRALAEQLFGSAIAVGRQVREGRGGPPIEVVGVVEDGKYTALAEARRGAIFRPLAQRPNTSAMLIVRADPPAAVRPDDLRRVIHHVDPALPIRSAATGGQLTALPLLPYRAAVAALGFLGVVASGLLLSGLHAMLAYAVVKRRREIGIRVALGADRVSVMRAVLARTAVIVAGGGALGALLAAGTGPLISSLVFGVSPAEGGVLVAILAMLAAITVASCAGPLRRSTTVHPLAALREE